MYVVHMNVFHFTSCQYSNRNHYHFSSHRLKAFTYECAFSNHKTILILLTFIILLQVYYTQLNRNDSALIDYTFTFVQVQLILHRKKQFAFLLVLKTKEISFRKST